MSRAKYLVVLLPLLGFLTPVHQLNTVLWPALAGAVYGLFSRDKKELLAGLPLALGMVAIVLSIYAIVDAYRLAKYLSLFPHIVGVWLALWILSFFLGSVITYRVRAR